MRARFCAIRAQPRVNLAQPSPEFCLKLKFNTFQVNVQATWPNNISARQRAVMALMRRGNLKVTGMLLKGGGRQSRRPRTRVHGLRCPPERLRLLAFPTTSPPLRTFFLLISCAARAVAVATRRARCQARTAGGRDRLVRQSGNLLTSDS